MSLALVTAAAAAVVIAPWVGYNLSRFDKRVYISAGLPTAMMSSSCDIGWYGPLRGYWSMQCFEAVPTKYEDASRQAVLYSNYVRSYYKAHLSDLPVVEVARVGRLWGWYRPSQMLTLEAPEGRSVPWSRVALVMLYSLEIAAFPGLFVLRRRKVPVSPLLGTCLTVTITALMVCGETRFRAPAEVAVVLLAVAGLHGLREHVIRRPSRDDVQQPEAGRGQPEGPTTAIEPRAWWK